MTLTAALEPSAVESIDGEEGLAALAGFSGGVHHIHGNQSPPNEVDTGIIDGIEELADGLAREARRLASSLPRHRIITLAGKLLGL
jgi:hypothetical protein